MPIVDVIFDYRSLQLFLFSNLYIPTTQAAIDSERTFLEMQPEREFWLDGLMEMNSLKDHRLGRTWQAAFAGKECQHVHSIKKTCRLIRC